MKKTVFFWIKGAVLCFLLLACLTLLGLITAPVSDLEERFPTTANLTEFHQLEENSVDVLIMGSSHAMTGFDPQVLYDEWGFTAYNLSGEQQSPFITSYWLEEALKTQNPKVVVLETHFLFPYFSATDALNMEEPYVHKALDYMRPSLTRLRAVAEAAYYRPEFGFFNLLIPGLRYHTRVSGLTQEDFDLARFGRTQNVLGFAPLPTLMEAAWYSPLQYPYQEEPEPMMPLMADCLERMLAMCRQRGIELVLVKTPSGSQTEGRCITMHEYADEHGLLFLDYNEEVYYSELEYDFLAYNADADHQNVWGAQRVTDYLGLVLTDKLGLEGRGEHPYWEEARIRHEEIVDPILYEY